MHRHPWMCRAKRPKKGTTVKQGPQKRNKHGSSVCHLILPPNSRNFQLKNGWFTQLGKVKKCPLWKKEIPFTNHPFSEFQPLLFQAAVEIWIPPGPAKWWVGGEGVFLGLGMPTHDRSMTICGNSKKQSWVQELKLYSISICVLPSTHV